MSRGGLEEGLGVDEIPPFGSALASPTEAAAETSHAPSEDAKTAHNEEGGEDSSLVGTLGLSG